jgi:hypothetical protein
MFQTFAALSAHITTKQVDAVHHDMIIYLTYTDPLSLISPPSILPPILPIRPSVVSSHPQSCILSFLLPFSTDLSQMSMINSARSKLLSHLSTLAAFSLVYPYRPIHWTWTTCWSPLSLSVSTYYIYHRYRAAYPQSYVSGAHPPPKLRFRSASPPQLRLRNIFPPKLRLRSAFPPKLRLRNSLPRKLPMMYVCTHAGHRHNTTPSSAPFLFLHRMAMNNDNDGNHQHVCVHVCL